MNNYELKLARKLLNLTEKESAFYLGEKMSQKAWDFYERHHPNNYGVKPYIVKKIEKLLSWRKQLIRETIENKPQNSPVIQYLDHNEFSDFLNFKAHYSATSTLNMDYGYNLIVFDKEDYAQFITKQQLEDSESSREEWANAKFAQIKQIQSKISVIDKELEDQRTILMTLCQTADFSFDETLSFINRLKTVSQKTDENYKEALDEYLAKNLPHTLYYAEKAKIKASIVEKTTEYIEKLKTWKMLYDQTKWLINSPTF